MPNKNYLAGYRFERRVMKDLEKKGYWVIRQGKSRFPDLVAIPLQGSGFLPKIIECKYGKDPRLSKDERKKLKELTKLNAHCFLARGKPRKQIEYEEIQ